MQCIPVDPDPLLEAFEAFLECGTATAAAVLGCAYQTYAQYRSGLRVLPRYHRNHIEHIMLDAMELIAEHDRRAFLEKLKCTH